MVDDQNGRQPKWKTTKMKILTFTKSIHKKNQLLAKINWIKIQTKLNQT